MSGEGEPRFRFEGAIAKVAGPDKPWWASWRGWDPDAPTDDAQGPSGGTKTLADALAAVSKSLWYECAIALPSERVPLDPRFARLVELPFQPTRDEAATRFARRLGLPDPRSEPAVKLVVNLLLGLQYELLPPSLPIWEGSDIAELTVWPAQKTLTDAELQQCQSEWGWSAAMLHDSLHEGIFNLVSDLDDRVRPLRVPDLSWRLGGA